MINVHPKVQRSALIRYARDGRIHPALVVEPKPGEYPRNGREKQALLAEVRAFARKSPVTRDIEFYFVHKSFPVDVRHNAKIHRLSLSSEFSDT